MWSITWLEFKKRSTNQSNDIIDCCFIFIFVCEAFFNNGYCHKNSNAFNIDP